MTEQETARIKYLLERAIKKHGDHEFFAGRAQNAIDTLDNVLEVDRPLFFRQGAREMVPGHVQYWIRSTVKFSESIDDKEHRGLQPYHVCSLGANGDNHHCSCVDFARHNSKEFQLGKKSYCKHIILAHALEYERTLRAAAALKQKLAEETLAPDLDSDEARRRFINNPNEFEAALAAA